VNVLVRFTGNHVGPSYLVERAFSRFEDAPVSGAEPKRMRINFIDYSAVEH
jgi:hypothetical protein